MQKVWSMKEPQSALFEMPGMHPVTGTLLAQRGISTTEEAEKFFKPNWETDTHDPFLFSQMKSGVERVLSALKNGEHITVFGDYDADGVTGLAVVISTLRKIAELMQGPTSYVLSPTSSDQKDPGPRAQDPGPYIDSYIPHRDAEGYGLSMKVISILKERGTTLLITVDCGIANVDEIAAFKEEGIETVVLDHHRYGEVLPDAILIHPSLPNEPYPFKHLAAVGVAWKFACGLVTHARENGIEIKEGWEKWLLDLVAIATVTDMVPLEGENRTLLRYGLLVLNKTRRPGLLSLIESSRANLGKISSETIGFTIGPRINAAGRMDHALRALELLMEEEPVKAKEKAVQLESLNRMRQTKTRAMMKEVEGWFLERKVGFAIALHHHAWSPALVGLVAGRMADKYARPCIGIGKHGDKWIGSGRSPKPVNITELVQKSGEGLLLRSGGHAQACGFALESDEAVLEFVKRFEAAGETIKDQLLDGPRLEIDAELQLGDINWKLLDAMNRFEPFGMGNSKPKFRSNNLRVITADRVGKTQNHLKLVVMSDDGRSRSFIGFNIGERQEEIELGSRINVVYDVGTNVWNGREEISCKIIDFEMA